MPYGIMVDSFSDVGAELSTNAPGCRSATILKIRYAKSTRAKKEWACTLQARVSLRIDEACGQQHREVFRGARALDQLQR